VSRRYRLYPTSEQEAVLRRHCGEAGFVWNLALEQFNQWRPGRSSPPGSQERFRQLAEARRETWLGEGSSAVQQQALRDFDQALRNWRGGTHRRPRPRKRGQDDGFCVRDLKVRTLSGKVAELLVPKCGSVRFRLSRPLPTDPGPPQPG
jgi:putative transposase